MNLHGSIAEVQNRVVGLYLKLQQRFKENGVISEVWSSMASDVSQQLKSLEGLSGHFWQELKKDDQTSQLISEVTNDIKARIPANTEDLPLQGCFESMLSLEEPITLKIYGPVLRGLREHRSDQALDLYIVVKAHLTRITRVMESYSGNPLILQRSHFLLERFEKEVQAPQRSVAERADRRKPAREKKPEPKTKRSSARNRPLSEKVVKHAKVRSERGKPLVEKINLRRQRARR